MKFITSAIPLAPKYVEISRTRTIPNNLEISVQTIKTRELEFFEVFNMLFFFTIHFQKIIFITFKAITLNVFPYIKEKII